MDQTYHFPKLRLVDVRPINQGGWPTFLLRDPLQLTDKSLLIPRYVAPILALCDGTHDRRELRGAMAERFGLMIDQELIDQLLAALDEVLLLDNDRFATACAERRDAYRRAPFRPPALAGSSYPADPTELRAMLHEYIDAVRADGVRPLDGRGVVSPHIDYMRGGLVYATVWKHAEELARAADLVVLLGTDHSGGEGQITLTRQHYATPFGVLPTARPIVDALAQVLGEEAAFAGELRHRTEHSIELAAIWLHAMRAEQPVEVVPILCGSFAHFVRGDADIAQDPTLDAVITTLAQATAGRRTLVVAAGDLAHVGPAFGGAPLDAAGLAQLRAADAELIEQMCAGDGQAFFEAIHLAGDSNNVCGVSPIYLALRLLGSGQGDLMAYDCCPADTHGTSVVSVCGITLR